ncbi:hypothetical protein F5I97DRAFT_1927626 [Phlebopus sp. FC_14]|nr:hypothetical protein F5I97DRAFT_1927626 [Phlebopus sp. FC_14]
MPVVDLGYAQHQGSYNGSSSTTSFLGIRYAAPSTGSSGMALNLVDVRGSDARNSSSYPSVNMRTEYKGTPQGTIETIGDVKCYVGTPTGSYDHTKLLVDDFAKAGYKTIAPDYLNGDEAPPYAMNNPDFDVKAWVMKHLPNTTRPPLDKVIAALKDQGVTKFAVTGYCFGGRSTFDLAIDNVIQVAIVAHPSQLAIPDDFEKYRDQAKEDIDKILDGFPPGYRRDLWPNCEHGFAVRANILDSLQLAGKEGAFINAVAWLKQYF